MRRLMTMAALALLLLAGGAQAQHVGVGGGIGAWSTSRGMEASDVATSLTATTTGLAAETLRTWTIQPGTMLTKPGFRLVAMATALNNANAKTLTVRVNGTSVGSLAAPTSAATSISLEVECWVRSATVLQCDRTNRTEAGVLSGGTAPATVDLAAAITVIVQGTTPTAAGDMTLVAFTSYFFRP